MERTVLLICLLAVSCSIQASPVMDLKRLYKEFFDWRTRDRPVQATSFDISRYDDRIESWNPAMFTIRFERAQQLKQKLLTVMREKLPKEEKVNYDILKNELDTYIEGYPFINYTYINPINNLDEPDRLMKTLKRFTKFNTRGDFDNYITRLQAIPKYLRQLTDLMQRAIAMNRTLHAVSMSRVQKKLETIVSNYDPYDSPYYEPFKNSSKIANSTIPPREWKSYQERTLTAVNNILHAYGTLLQFIKYEYLPKTRQDYGVWSWEGGKDFYKAVMKWYLSVDMNPEEVHDIGLKEVERIHGLMKKIMMKQHPEIKTVKGYFDILKNDSNFYFTNGTEAIYEYERIIDEIKPLMKNYFPDSIPDIPLLVKATEEDGASGYYQRGSADGSTPAVFFTNVHRPEEVLKPGMKPLTLHEAIPGHHTQISYVITAKNPNFRSKPEYSFRHRAPFAFPKFTAIMEGWALYAEYLGEEMGVYTNDYEMMGRYSSEIFRACRLVVDTGIHYFRWNRTRAIEYLRKYIADSDSFIAFEVDRYITWPGQALSYKIGEIKIKEARKMAMDALGNKFNIKEFHRVVLENGGQPLDVLKSTIQTWIDDVKTKRDCIAGAAPSLQLTTVNSVAVILSSVACYFRPGL